MNGYAAGGYVEGPSATVTLADDECVLDRTGSCQRSDGAHGHVPLDPRWEWLEVCRFGALAPTYLRGRCLHTEVVPVESALDPDVVVARLCRTCDTQLPGDQP